MTDTFNPAGGRARTLPKAETISARAQEVRSERRRRKEDGPLSGLKLHVPDNLKEPGFEYRWLNDDDKGRVYQKTVHDDWDVVKTKAIEGQGEGTPVTRLVGKGEGGQPMRAILVRKPKEFHEEDRRKMLAGLKEREEAIKRGEPQSPEGLSQKQHAYIPNVHGEGHSTGPGENRIGD